MSRNKIIWMRVGDLEVHPYAQRRLVPAQINKRMKEIVLNAIGVLHAVPSGDRLLVVDGQHRLVALKRHGYDEFRVPVMVHEEARDSAKLAHALFLQLNARANTPPWDLFVNELGMGDERAVAISKIMAAHDRSLARLPSEGTAACVATLKRVYDMDAGATLDATVSTLIEAYGARKEALDGDLVWGTALVLHKWNGEIDRKTLSTKLARYPGGANGVIGDARGLRRVRRASSGKCVAETIVSAYNSGKREGNRLAI